MKIAPARKNMQNYLTRKILAVVLLLILVSLGACSSAVLVDTWKDPTVNNISFKRVVAMALTSDATTTRTIEDQMVEMIRKRGIAADAFHQVNASEELAGTQSLSELKKSSAELLDKNYDGAIVFRIVSVDKEVSYVPGSYPLHYHQFWSYYDYYPWPMSYDPGYLRTDTIARAEVLLFSLRENRLLWSALSESFNPSSTSDLVKKVAASVTKKLETEKLIAERS